MPPCPAQNNFDPVHIAILTFDGFNELDSCIALGILNRVKRPGWRVSIACPTARVRSMNGVVVEAQATLAEACAADAARGAGPARLSVAPNVGAENDNAASLAASGAGVACLPGDQPGRPGCRRRAVAPNSPRARPIKARDDGSGTAKAL